MSKHNRLFPFHGRRKQLRYASIWWRRQTFSVTMQRRQLFKTAYNFRTKSASHLRRAVWCFSGRLFMPSRKFVFWNQTIYRSLCLLYLHLLFLILVYSTRDLELCFEVRWLPPCIITPTLLFKCSRFQVRHTEKGKNTLRSHLPERSNSSQIQLLLIALVAAFAFFASLISDICCMAYWTITYALWSPTLSCNLFKYTQQKKTNLFVAYLWKNYITFGRSANTHSRLNVVCTTQWNWVSPEYIWSRVSKG